MSPNIQFTQKEEDLLDAIWAEIGDEIANAPEDAGDEDETHDDKEHPDNTK